MSDSAWPNDVLDDVVTELPVELYDFLYKDTERIASYYAQLFQGRVVSQETTNANKASRDQALKGTIGVFGGDFKFNKETMESLKEILDPHDRATVEVLSYFADYDYLHRNLQEAPHGGLILARGSINLVDTSIASIVSSFADYMLRSEKSKANNKRDQAAIANWEMVKSVMPSIKLPSSFLLQSETGDLIAGTLKDSGMQEPIISYNFRHGLAGLKEIYLIGILEKVVPVEETEMVNMIAMAGTMANALSAMMFSPDAFRVTPIALFRVFSSVDLMARDQTETQVSDVDTIGIVDYLDKNG